jgi:hydrogenase maturation protein HypF
MEDRRLGRPPADAARAFQRGFAQGVANCVKTLCRRHGVDTIVLSGGVFQNDLLLRDLKALVEPEPLRLWTNRQVPANDGGISLGQAALAAIEVASRQR